MTIILNGVERILSMDTTLLQLLEKQNVLDKRIAVEVNESIIPRSLYPSTSLNNGDNIEIVHAIGGG